MNSNDVIPKFDELVTFCRKLQDAKRVASGLRFVIRDNRICVDPVPPHGPDCEHYSLEENSKEIRACIQKVRHGLSEWFNLDSNRWNASNIGKMLKSIETEFREQTYHVEAGKAYNSFTMFFLVKESVELTFYMLSPAFTRHRWRINKLRALNKYAEGYFVRRQRRASFQTLGMLVEMAIALDDMRRHDGSDERVMPIITTMVNQNTLVHLKNQFKDIE